MNLNTFLRPHEKISQFFSSRHLSLLGSCPILFWKRLKVTSCPAPNPCLAPGAPSTWRRKWRELGHSRPVCGVSVLIEEIWTGIGFPTLLLVLTLGKFLNYYEALSPEVSKRRITHLRAVGGVRSHDVTFRKCWLGRR